MVATMVDFDGLLGYGKIAAGAFVGLVGAKINSL
jgi:hypothetical protein